MKSRGELNALGKEFRLDVLKPTPVKGSRWLPHVSGDVFIKPQKDGNMSGDPAQACALVMSSSNLQAQLEVLQNEFKNLESSLADREVKAATESNSSSHDYGDIKSVKRLEFLSAGYNFLSAFRQEAEKTTSRSH